jgi:hypothetical protein
MHRIAVPVRGEWPAGLACVSWTASWLCLLLQHCFASSFAAAAGMNAAAAAAAVAVAVAAVVDTCLVACHA